MLDQQQQIDFTELWKDAQPTVVAYVRGIVRDSQSSRDIVQNVAVVLMKKFPLWDSSRDFLAWALGIAKFEILAHRRDSARHRVVFNEELLESITEMWPVISTKIEVEEPALHECLENLDANAREIVRLRYFEDLMIPHVADRIGSTAGAVRVALMRIRRQLLRCVNRRLENLGR